MTVFSSQIPSCEPGRVADRHKGEASKRGGREKGAEHEKERRGRGFFGVEWALEMAANSPAHSSQGPTFFPYYQCLERTLKSRVSLPMKTIDCLSRHLDLELLNCPTSSDGLVFFI